MLLKPLNQVIEGYNDKIVVNTSGHELGKINRLKVHDPVGHKVQQHRPHVNRLVHEKHPSYVKPLDAHNDERQALILALISITSFGVWWIE